MYPPKHPTPCGPQHSVGYYGPSAMQTHRSQPSVEVRHQCYNERSIVIIDPRTDQTGLSNSLQERSIVHDVLPPRKSHSSICSTPGLLHSTTLFTAVTDSVNVAKASTLEKTGKYSCNILENSDTNRTFDQCQLAQEVFLCSLSSLMLNCQVF